MKNSIKKKVRQMRLTKKLEKKRGKKSATKKKVVGIATAKQSPEQRQKFLEAVERYFADPDLILWLKKMWGREDIDNKSISHWLQMLRFSVCSPDGLDHDHSIKLVKQNGVTVPMVGINMATFVLWVNPAYPRLPDLPAGNVVTLDDLFPDWCRSINDFLPKDQ